MSQSSGSSPSSAEIADIDVKTTASALAQALMESAEYQAFEHASDLLRLDEVAQQAILDFQAKQQSLQMMLQLNAVSPEDRVELERLQQAFLERESVTAYLTAQENFTVLCQATASLLSERIGLNFASACGRSCCG